MSIRVGYAVGSGEPVDIPVRHLAVTGQTQESGKTTTLEALVARSGVTALAFVTKRGESAFADGRRVQPYFRDRADWQFVTSILDATLQEKNKFLRPWIMKICRTTRTLAEVQQAVRKALETAKGINEGVYTQLDAYLDLLVPEIQRAKLAPSLDIRAGLNVMDVSSSPTPMQMLLVQSALDWVNEHARNTVVIVPEAWEFIPEGKGSPVKASATTLVRKGAGIGNYIWVDSQDMAGVDKTILRGCAVWIIGVQREANEIKRNLSNIPASIKRPTAAQVATLERGQFYVCHGSHAVKTYVQPAWMDEHEAVAIALGGLPIPRRAPTHPEEPTVKESEARALREENEALRRRLDEFERRERRAESSNDRVPESAPASGRRDSGDAGSTPVSASALDEEGLYRRILDRLLREGPPHLRVSTERPELTVEIERKVVTIDGTSVKGRVAKLLATGFFGSPQGQGETRTELRRTGPDINTGTLSKVFAEFLADGFLQKHGMTKYVEVPDMKVNIVER
jgi:hypothetical protein